MTRAIRPPVTCRPHSIVIVLIVLGIVAIWWIFLFPHTRPYRVRKGESIVKEKLKRIKAPAGDRLSELTTSHQAGWPDATAIYISDSDCAYLKTYYGEEFARQGFAFQHEYKSLESSPEPDSLSFSETDYDAGMICNSSERQPRSYMIILTWTNARE